MLLRVTKEDIRKGRPESELFCPIALSLRRRGFVHVRVKPHTLLAGDQCVEMPPRATDFVRLFDYYGRNHVKPTTFRLALTPPKPQKKGGG